MKRLLVTFLIIETALTTWSQSRVDSYKINHSEIKIYLDSLTKKYKEPNPSMQLDYSYFVGTGYQYYMITFGENVKLLNAPIKESNYKKSLKFGDTLLFPLFAGGREPSMLAFSYPCGDLCYDAFYFCITKKGEYGFITQNDFIYPQYVFSIPSTDYLVCKCNKSAIAKKDYTKFRIFNSSDIYYSDDKKYLVYSIDKRNDKYYKNIYLFQVGSWSEKYLGKGYSPTFIENSIVYWSQEENETNSQKIHLFDLATNHDEIIFSVPDSLTLMSCGDDGCFPRKIVIKDINNEKLINLSFCSKIYKPEYNSECGQQAEFTINKKGKLVEIK